MNIKAYAVVLLFCILPEVITECIPSVTCALPNCVCLERASPTGLDRTQIPQIVLFTFDDAVRRQELEYYNRLFSEDRLNPNGCPVTITLFLQDKNTEYGAVRALHQRGMEIAVHSISHKSPQAEWRDMTEPDLRREVYGQKLNIHRKAGVPLDEIRGWRSPFLQPSGNRLFKVLSDKTYGFSYDSTLATEKRNLEEPTPWPFTLDFGFKMSCGTPPCPSGKFPGFWEFLVTPLIDNENFPRIYVDSYRPENISQSLKYLKQNFMSYYHGNRAPYMINLHAAWFAYRHNLEAMDLFVKSLLKYEDVYVVTIQQAIEWMRSPVTLNSVKHFKPWRCDSPKLRNAVIPGEMEQQDAFAASTFLPTPPTPPTCEQGVNCRLPSCRCADSGPPGGIVDTALPQIVLFTFDDSANAQSIGFYERLFPIWRKNPNGSPISMTLFLSHKSTDYTLVRKLYDRGMEIAVHSSMQSSSSNFWQNASREELQHRILSQRTRINSMAGIPLEGIQGWRTPFSQPAGDRQYEILDMNGFKYDSTLTVSKTSLNDLIDWPFTLDFGWNKPCPRNPCPKARYPGLWVFPVVNLVDPSTELPCRYVDSCRPENKSATLNYLRRNFDSYYHGNRAPFMLNMHSSWFLLNTEYFDAVDEFIRDILVLSDVYIVTVQQALEWVKRPTALGGMSSFSPWLNHANGLHRNKVKFGRNNDTSVLLTPSSDGNPNTEEVSQGKQDWIVIVLIVVASVFGTCILFTTGMHILRKKQMQKRANSIREAITVTSERNSVTDWLNTFPRRLSQLSCPVADSLGSQDRASDCGNVNYGYSEGERESFTDRCHKTLIPSNSLTLNPELLETNYSRDLAIWNQQEKKIPHILNKSQKRKLKDNKMRGLPVEVIQSNARSKVKKQEITSRKPWSFVWDPCKNQSHSESIFNPNLINRNASPANSWVQDDYETTSKPSASQLGVSAVGRVRRSGGYDFLGGEEDSNIAYSSRSHPRPHKEYGRPAGNPESFHSSTMPNKPKRRRHTRSNETGDDQRRVPRHSESFDYATKDYTSYDRDFTSEGRRRQSDDKQRKSRVRDKSHREISDKTNERLRSSSPVDDQYAADPRITKEVEEEWERELRKQLDKFLKSKNALKGLEYYR